MAFENGPCQIVEVAPAGLAVVSLTLLLGGIDVRRESDHHRMPDQAFARPEIA